MGEKNDFGQKKDNSKQVLKKPVVWKELYIYRKSDAIYQLTVEFCRRYLPPHGNGADKNTELEGC